LVRRGGNVKAGKKKVTTAKSNSKRSKPLDRMELKKIFDRLSTVSKKKGYVTYHEITKALPSNSTSPDHMDEMINMLNEKNVQISGSRMENAGSTILDVVKSPDLKKNKVFEGIKEILVRKDRAPHDENDAIGDYGRSRMDDPVRKPNQTDIHPFLQKNFKPS